MRETEKGNRSSLKVRFTLAMVLMSLIPGLILAVVYYRNVRDFYQDKTWMYQENTLRLMDAKMQDIIKQSEVVLNQVLGLSVTSDLFSGYTEMNAYERLNLMRNINGTLSNIRIANNSIDHIYLLAFDGGAYSSNAGWNKREFAENTWTEIREDQPGGSIIVPTHPAAYKYLNCGAADPLVVSIVTYLNRYTGNSVIGLVQIDLSYEKIRAAMDCMEMDDSDMAFVVDEEGRVIFAPKESMAGLSAADVSLGTYSLAQILSAVDGVAEEDGNFSIHLDYGRDSGTIRKRRVGNSGFSIIQINSGRMLKQELDRFRKVWAAVVGACMVSAALLASSLSAGIVKPVTSLIRSMSRVSRGDFSTKVETPKDKDLSELALSFNTMVSEVDKLMHENIEKERERLNMEQTALNSQINSHFLYNTLNTVKWMAVRARNEEIARMVVALVNMLEYSCKKIDVPVLISEEINFIKNYVCIQEGRCCSSVHMKFDIDPKLENCLVLKMLLQPVVENAMQHGFGEDNIDNRILITGRLLGDRVQFQIRDNGQGFLYEGFDKLTGVGLHNIQDRIRLNYGDGYGVELESEPGEGTAVTVEIPVCEKAEEADGEDFNR